MVELGMEIGSHTCSHPDLKRIPRVDAKREIEDSKRELEQQLGIPVTSFCYPSGRFSAEALGLVRESGYRSACTTEIGTWNGDDLFSIPRIPVMASDVFFVFKKKMMDPTGLLGRIH